METILRELRFIEAEQKECKGDIKEKQVTEIGDKYWDPSQDLLT